ncbi:hypothetical protein [Hansschlegelia zhihuaiae]|uniref:Uncharacterized protein n=1 Tax=Hansschlegelia zhihuaiae TaxID=405005 RepID=A0A4Q0MF67_9HYPH|nr:hypothetical protein [Hansschlegelia zhihuaiae]RXF72108.1 hypothetical protein EK403_14965 [Hansschlegelia zhihuaiae]
MVKAKKPKGWYGKEAKAERKAAREARAERRRIEGRLAEARKRRREDARALVERQAAAVCETAEASRAARAERDRAYDRQAKKLRRELEPKLSGVDRGTPHTRRQHRKTSFERLCDERVVTGEMAQAALEIERVYLAVCGAVVVRAQAIEPRGGRGGTGPMSDEVAMAHASRYRPWADEMARLRKAGDWPMLEIVIDVVVDGRTLRDVEIDKGMRNGSARHALCWALLKYAVMARWADAALLVQYEARHDVHRRALQAA